VTAVDRRKPSLDRALAVARTAPPTWDAAQTNEVWAGIEGRRRTRARVRQVGAGLAVVGLAIAGLFGLASPSPEGASGPTTALAASDVPAEVRSPAAATRPPVESSVEPSVEPIVEPPNGPSDQAVVLARAEAVAHAGEHAHYQAAEDWSGQLDVHDGAIGISGPGAAFSVHTEASATVVSVQAAVVVVEYAAERRELHAGEILRIESEAIVAHAPARKEPRERVTAEVLLSRADDARRRGDLAAAAKLLRQFTKRHGSHQDAATAWFQLGKVERRRGRHRAAASAFASSRRLLRGKVLEGDALAEHARSLAAAGRRRDAEARAREYLRWKPGGLHAADMRAIVDAG